MRRQDIQAILVAGAMLLLVGGCRQSENVKNEPSLAMRSETVGTGGDKNIQSGQPTQKTVAATEAKPRPPVYADGLITRDDRKTGAPLGDSFLNDGRTKWKANKGIVVTSNGVSANSPAGGHHSIPVIAGVIKLEADVSAKGSGFTGIALGRDDLSSNFWNNLTLVFFVRNGGYGLFTGKKDIVRKLDKGLLKKDGLDHLALELDTASRTVTASLNGTVVVDKQKLPNDVRTDAITAAGFRINDPVKAGQPRVCNYRAEVISSATAGLKPVDYSMFFVNPDEEVSLVWQAGCMGPTDQVPYTVADYTGKRVTSATAQLKADSSVELRQKFATGYYEISFPEAGQTFGVVALKAHSGPVDPFFCMDSALCWLETRRKERAGLVKILARCGIAMSRERLSHGSVNPDKDKWNLVGGPRDCKYIRGLYQTEKVPVLEMLHGAGRHMQPLSRSPYFPQNLPETALAWEQLAGHWQNVWGGVEVGNEPDLQLLPADQYSTLVKTASYAMREAKVKVPVVSGVFAGMPPAPFFTAFAANGALADSDVISFHSYDKAPDVEGMLRQYRQWLKSYGVESMPLWHTECGWSWRNGPARPPVKQDAESALEITAKSIETKVCGAARHFPFVYVYYEEGIKNFGMMGREVSPLRSMAGYAVCTSLLSGMDYLGDVIGVGKQVKLARVFGKAGSDKCLVFLYTGKLSADAEIGFPCKYRQVLGVDGRALKTGNGSVPVPDGLSYVRTDIAALGDNLKRDTSAAKLYALGKSSVMIQRLASPLVIQFLPDTAPLRMSSCRYLVSRDAAKSLPINVRIHNLSASPVEATLSLQLPGGEKTMHKPITVPGHGKIDVAWKVDASTSLDIADTRMITIEATAKGVAQPSPAAIPMTMDGNLEEHLKRHSSQKQLPITDLSRWQKNIAGHGQAAFSKKSDVWRMDCSYSVAANCWSYPILNLQQTLEPGVDTGFLLRARIIGQGRNIAIMANPNNPEGFWMNDLFPADGEWHTVYVPFADMKPGPGHAGMQNTRQDITKWNRIAVGMGGGTKHNAIEVSHLYVVGKKQ